MSSQVHISTHPLVRSKMTLLRDQSTDPKKFRELLREVATLIAYEATMDLVTEDVTVMTPLGPAEGSMLRERVGLVPIIRAGLGMVAGVWNLMPNAEVWHIGLQRDEDTLESTNYYTRLPTRPAVDVSLVLDPMLATGGSAIKAVDILKRWGLKRIKFVGVIAAVPGLDRFTKAHPDVPLYLAAVDADLTEMGYIVPGLGNAGDRQFGTG